MDNRVVINSVSYFLNSPLYKIGQALGVTIIDNPPCVETLNT